MSFSCINEYLATYICVYMNEYNRAVVAIELNASQKSRDGDGMNGSDMR